MVHGTTCYIEWTHTDKKEKEKRKKRGICYAKIALYAQNIDTIQLGSMVNKIGKANMIA